jgi:hypothetical protein
VSPTAALIFACRNATFFSLDVGDISSLAAARALGFVG